MQTQEIVVERSPFDGLGDAGRVVAAAFAAAYDMPEVWAALRFHRTTQRQDFTWCLDSQVFRFWQDSGTREICHLAFCDLREKAAEWLEGRK